MEWGRSVAFGIEEEFGMSHVATLWVILHSSGAGTAHTPGQLYSVEKCEVAYRSDTNQYRTLQKRGVKNRQGFMKLNLVSKK